MHGGGGRAGKDGKIWQNEGKVLASSGPFRVKAYLIENWVRRMSTWRFDIKVSSLANPDCANADMIALRFVNVLAFACCGCQRGTRVHHTGEKR